ncbi:MAG: hypothetical protein RLO12_13895, partial [Fulvivirga sp.]
QKKLWPVMYRITALIELSGIMRNTSQFYSLELNPQKFYMSILDFVLPEPELSPSLYDDITRLQMLICHGNTDKT